MNTYPILSNQTRCISFALVLVFSYAASIVAAPFIVTTTVDNGMNSSPTPGSLRAGINAVNSGITNEINFDILTSDPGYNHANNTWTIKPPVDLPNITQTVTIDGYAGHPGGATPNKLAQGDDAVLTIVLNGSNYTVGDGLSTGSGLHFIAGSDNSVVRGLCINQWLLCGILVDGFYPGPLSNISIVGNFIGTNAQGTKQMANAIGIGVAGANNTSIGSNKVEDRNLIAGSFGNWVGAFYASNPFDFSASCICTVFETQTIILNNYIGTDKSGTSALGNSLAGVTFTGSVASELGNNNSPYKNIISGHTILGVFLVVTEGVVIENNYIGTNVTGTQAIANDGNGIRAVASDSTSIQNNLISGNGSGIVIGDAVEGAPTTNTTIVNNLIGTDWSGTKSVPNAYYGVQIYGETTTLGDLSGNTKNTISGNGQGGVLISSYLGTNNNVVNNFIGLNAKGTLALANEGNGLQIGEVGGVGGATNNVIGG